MFLEEKPRETLRLREQNSLFPAGPVIKSVLLYLQTKNLKKTAKKSSALCGLAHNFATVSRSMT